ncbi:hypothetical protein ACFX13_028749 [Malus domestica]
MATKDEIVDYLNITLEDSLDLEERFDSSIHLVGQLIADHEPSQNVVKETLRSAWNKMGVVRVLKAKDNKYIIAVGDEVVARKLMEGNLWFVKDYTFSVKLWPLYHSIDDIKLDRAIF